MFIRRAIEAELQQLLQEYPVVTILLPLGDSRLEGHFVG